MFRFLELLPFQESFDGLAICAISFFFFSFFLFWRLDKVFEFKFLFLENFAIFFFTILTILLEFMKFKTFFRETQYKIKKYDS